LLLGSTDGFLVLLLPCETTIKPKRLASKYAMRIFTISLSPFPFPLALAFVVVDVVACSLVVDSSQNTRQAAKIIL